MRVKRIVIGICGIGQGHVLRQSVVLTHLLARGHQVVTFAFGESYRFLQEFFPEVSRIRVRVPWVYCNETGIDFARTGKDTNNRKCAYLADNFLAMDYAIYLLDGEPDLILTDYEPVSAQLAYALGRPLVCVDQQSKFLGFKTPDVNGFSRKEEASRLRLFFPQATRRFATSFFPVTSEADPGYPVTIIPPILRPQFNKLMTGGTSQGNGPDVLVYLSPYGNAKPKLGDIIQVLQECSDYRFTLYSSRVDANVCCPMDNVRLKRFSHQGFLHDLWRSMAVISTAGHQLISEAVYLGKPILALPFAIYEQQYNARMVENYQLGVVAQEFDAGSLSLFLGSLQMFVHNASELTKVMGAYDGIGVLLGELAQDFDL